MFEKHFFGAAFLNRSTNDILGQLILCRGDCRVHCRMFSVIPDSHPLDVSSTYAVVTCKNVYRPCPFSLGVGGGTINSLVNITALELAFFLTLYSAGSEKIALWLEQTLYLVERTETES